eukprot:CAMPEP_0174726460 /NCGR_PEP_ID=MMETSP1094-20130205/47869_1 /TAXON_ID=156173 /ORGANISM="Chrysochromulina brevifilum, Strain UTEX LB 985" /LENGTH=128 /DNA_ID=CAMNT_0015928047 /DNA_START=534 /DNA_END=920 /DNA_ORIENTATION=+
MACRQASKACRASTHARHLQAVRSKAARFVALRECANRRWRCTGEVGWRCAGASNGKRGRDAMSAKRSVLAGCATRVLDPTRRASTAIGGWAHIAGDTVSSYLLLWSLSLTVHQFNHRRETLVTARDV